MDKIQSFSLLFYFGQKLLLKYLAPNTISCCQIPLIHLTQGKYLSQIEQNILYSKTSNLYHTSKISLSTTSLRAKAKILFKLYHKSKIILYSQTSKLSHTMKNISLNYLHRAIYPLNYLTLSKITFSSISHQAIYFVFTNL